MSIPVSCSCGQQFMAQPHLAGKQVACPSCGKPLSIPAPAGAVAAAASAIPAASAGSGSVVTCVCGKSFKAPPHLAGQRVACPDCGQPIDVPGGAGKSPVAAATSPRQKKDKKAVPAPAPAAWQPADSAGLGWDDALAAPDLNAAGGFASGPAAAHRRVERDTIEPMTMYAIWAGGGAVVLLVLLILGHIVWNAFADKEQDGAAPGETPSAEQIPVEPVPAERAAPPAGKTPSPSGSPAPGAEA